MGPALVSVVLLAAWLGAAVLVAVVVAPAAFAVLPTRTLAGAVVGRVLPVLFWSGMVAGIAGLYLLRPSSMRGWLGVSLVALVVACAGAQLGVAPRIATVRASVQGAVDALDPSDARRQTFGRLHAMSVGLMGLGAVASGVALVIVSRSLIRSTP